MLRPVNVFTPAVLANYRRLQEEGPHGVGYLLPDGEKIGRAFQNWVDQHVAAQNQAGNVRINPLGHVNPLVDIYV